MSGGHGALPLAWDWIEDQLVVTHSNTDDVQRGAVVHQIDGTPVADAIAQAEALISGATPQWKRYNALTQLHRGRGASQVDLALDDGRTVRVVRGGNAMVAEPRPDVICELEPGIWYVDIDRVTDAQFAEALPKLESATGLVFDLRGYPRSVSVAVLSHLTDHPITCARWTIPVVMRPGREHMRFSFGNWVVRPAEPRLRAKAAFVTDGRAISYAETYLGIVEHYRLAEIVGSPTAGTNGNVNQFELPGGYSIAWTGMRVLKHDGSRHHGVGILPTVPSRRTIAGVRAGRDEVLERAIEVVRMH